MSKIDRAYRPGDEIQINQLYGRITGAYRSAAEYNWEWLETWKGLASIWLAFDESRAASDQLICQYSLIPTPLAFWGKKILTGKTENCMSHPDFRGKGMYFYHEQKYFEEAKKIYPVFFTTAGHVARGAPGKVRQKLGYRPFDYWVTYSLWLNKLELSKEINSKLPKILNKWARMAHIISWLIASILLKITSSTFVLKNGNFEDYSEEDAPLTEIEKLWQENAKLYGISVDRTAEYMDWRINKNPYISHRYLCYYEASKLKGYIIYTIQDGTVHLVDILVDAKDTQIFRALFDRLKHISRIKGYSQLKCHTLSKNQFLIDQLRLGKFINFADLFVGLKQKKTDHPMQFFVYIAEDIQGEGEVWDNQHWYFTDLVKEGRPYTARLIE